MQFHFVVVFDSDTKKWFIEGDTSPYFQDGNVFYPDRSNSPEWGHDGWHLPEKGSAEEALENELFGTLSSLVDTFPIPE